MDKQLLEELNRNREIMGLNHLIFEQSDFVMGIEREKECPCMDDNGIPDGTTAPVCCNDDITESNFPTTSVCPVWIFSKVWVCLTCSSPVNSAIIPFLIFYSSIFFFNMFC